MNRSIQLESLGRLYAQVIHFRWFRATSMMYFFKVSCGLGESVTASNLVVSNPSHLLWF
jgi:hypothetical protein